MSIYATNISIDDPVIYQGSHIRPHDTDPRGGGVDVATIPDHIEGAADMVRLSVYEDGGASGCVLLTRAQARAVGVALFGEDVLASLDHAERDNRRLQAAIDRIRDLHRPHDCTTDHIKASTPVPCVNDGVCRGCANDYPCRTINTLEQQ